MVLILMFPVSSDVTINIILTCTVSSNIKIIFDTSLSEETYIEINHISFSPLLSCLIPPIGVKLKKIDTALLSLDAFKTAWLRCCDLESELTKRNMKVGYIISYHIIMRFRHEHYEISRVY